LRWRMIVLLWYSPGVEDFAKTTVLKQFDRGQVKKLPKQK